MENLFFPSAFIKASFFLYIKRWIWIGQIPPQYRSYPTSLLIKKFLSAVFSFSFCLANISIS